MDWFLYDNGLRRESANTYKHHHTKTLYIYYICGHIWDSLAVSCLWDLFFIFVSIFIMINRIISWTKTHFLLLRAYLEYVLLFSYDNVHDESE